ncbi:LysE family translocator [Aliidiomarina celeris]|uniref:LysE family translocator n=1 Tax=Aliidiomarina celeris TaxID=2249428 RepID=UPI000DE8E26A|nr:LysE family translocator [Aliidiomarina celeris]
MFTKLINSPYLFEFLTMAFAHLLAVASPGPDFAVVSRYSVRFGARIGVWVSLGIGLGILVHVTYSVLGLAIIINQTPWLYSVLLLVAALYFAWLAAQLLRAKPPLANTTVSEPLQTSAATQHSPEPQSFQQMSIKKAIGLGFLTNGLNVKATLFFLALFTSIISPQTPVLIKSGYGLYLAVATFVWFAALSLLLGKTRLRGWLLVHGYWFDRLMGLMLGLLALNMVWQLIKG